MELTDAPAMLARGHNRVKQIPPNSAAPLENALPVWSPPIRQPVLATPIIHALLENRFGWLAFCRTCRAVQVLLALGLRERAGDAGSGQRSEIIDLQQVSAQAIIPAGDQTAAVRV
jgi:hypothetical protein